MQDLFNKIISYHDLINGDLVPDKMEPTTIAKFLKSEQLTCKDMIVGRYKGNKVIRKLKVSSANPIAHKHFPVKKSIDHQTYFQSKYQEVLKYIDSYAFKKMTIHKVALYESPLTMPIETDWNEIEKDRLRYCYFNQLLENLKTEHIYEIRQITLIDDEETCKKKISKLHRLLNSFLIELADRYKIKQADFTLQLKNEYTNRDCAILIYLSISEILDHTFKSFKQYMDLNLNIPCSSILINNTNFIIKTKLIEEKLNELTIDNELKGILKGELTNILKFQKTKRISYNDYQYYTVLFKSLKKVFLKKKLDIIESDKIITHLISINFQNELFFEYLIDSLINASNDFDEIKERHKFLRIKKKELEQTKVLISSVDDNNNLINKLLSWFKIEIHHLKLDIEAEENQAQNVNEKAIKLISSLNVSEIALLFRLMNELKVFKSDKIADIAKWIMESFTNEKGISYSQTSIRNKMYDASTANIRKIKKIAIELKEACNSL